MDVVKAIMHDLNKDCYYHIPGEEYEYKGKKERSRRACTQCGKPLSRWSPWM